MLQMIEQSFRMGFLSCSEHSLHPRRECCPSTLIGLDLPPTALIDITRKRKQILNCTQEIAKAKLE
jgi:hypothetical protein